MILVEIIRPWPNPTRDGIVNVLFLIVLVLAVVVLSILHIRRAGSGELDVVFGPESLSLPGVGKVSPYEVEYSGSFRFPFFPEQVVLRIRVRNPGIFRRGTRAIALDLGYYENSGQLKEQLIAFAGEQD